MVDIPKITLIYKLTFTLEDTGGGHHLAEMMEIHNPSRAAPGTQSGARPLAASPLAAQQHLPVASSADLRRRCEKRQ